jgi:hypothetical protein
VAVLLGDPEQILRCHQVPACGRVASTVGITVSDLQSFERPSPAVVGIVQIPDLRAVLPKEDVLMGDLAGELQSRPEDQLPFENLQRTRTQLHHPVFTGLRMVFVMSHHAGLAHLDLPLSQRRDRHGQTSRRYGNVLLFQETQGWGPIRIYIMLLDGNVEDTKSKGKAGGGLPAGIE